MSLYPFDAMPMVSCIVVVMTASTDLRQCSVHLSHHSPVSTSYLTSAQIFIMRCARNILSGYLAYSFAMLNSVSCHFPLILHGLDLIFMVSFSLILYISCLVLNEISNHGNNPHITILRPHQVQFSDTECGRVVFQLTMIVVQVTGSRVTSISPAQNPLFVIII